MALGWAGRCVGCRELSMPSIFVLRIKPSHRQACVLTVNLSMAPASSLHYYTAVAAPDGIQAITVD
uniref:Uncharacterized protein n=1 Tax=Kalanchoe fedtschenkoi TaxID=63787 RepID=A0A7N1A5C0_KALFE